MIYLVEDDSSIRELVIYALNSTGLEAKGFEKPSEFWKAVEEEEPSLVILDVMLPEESGIDVLKKIRSNPAIEKLPVIMETAKTSEYDRINGLESGADDYISKPFSMMEMVARVKALIRRSEYKHEEKDYTTATEETVETLFTNYYKAKKAYNTLTANVGEEISDEEARVIKVQYIHIDTTKTKTNKATKQLEEVISLVNGGYQTFAKEAKQYSDDELVTKTIKKNEATQDYEIAAFDLANEEMSSIITQDDGLYLVYCENSYLKDETAQNKSAIIESTKNSAFSKVYDNYISDVKSDFNTSAWDDIALPDGENMVSTNIMDVFDTIAAE